MFTILKLWKNIKLNIARVYIYEDLIKKPNDVIPEIINWLNWDWNEKYLSPHENKNVFTASSAQIRKKFYSSS